MEAATVAPDDIRRSLYGVPPDRFVEERDAWVKRLREVGRRDLAGTVGRWRKPTSAAWAVDQIALHDPGVLEQLLAVGDRVREAHASGGKVIPTGSANDLQAAISEGRDRAAEYLEQLDTDPGPHVDEIERTLMTAAVDPDRRQAVATGYLVRPLPAAGFSVLDGVQLTSPDDGSGGDGPDRREVQRLRNELSRLDRRRRATTDAAERAQERIQQMREELDEAEDEAQQERDRIARLDAELAETKERLDAALGGGG